jgi:hypothetical protein
MSSTIITFIFQVIFSILILSVLTVSSAHYLIPLESYSKRKPGPSINYFSSLCIHLKINVAPRNIRPSIFFRKKAVLIMAALFYVFIYRVNQPDKADSFGSLKRLTNNFESKSMTFLNKKILSDNKIPTIKCHSTAILFYGSLDPMPEHVWKRYLLNTHNTSDVFYFGPRLKNTSLSELKSLLDDTFGHNRLSNWGSFTNIDNQHSNQDPIHQTIMHHLTLLYSIKSVFRLALNHTSHQCIEHYENILLVSLDIIPLHYIHLPPLSTKNTVFHLWNHNNPPKNDESMHINHPILYFQDGSDGTTCMRIIDAIQLSLDLWAVHGRRPRIESVLREAFHGAGIRSIVRLYYLCGMI